MRPAEGQPLSRSRLLAILRGKAPVGTERFVIGRILLDAPISERIDLALQSGLIWYRFAKRFEALQGLGGRRYIFVKVASTRFCLRGKT